LRGKIARLISEREREKVPFLDLSNLSVDDTKERERETNLMAFTDSLLST